MNICSLEVAIREKCRSSHFQSEGGVKNFRTGGGVKNFRTWWVIDLRWGGGGGGGGQYTITYHGNMELPFY